MAIVRDFIACNGVHVVVHDDCFRDVPLAEMARRVAAYWRVVHEIERAEGMRRYNELRAEGMSDTEIWEKTKDRAWVEKRFPLPTEEEMLQKLFQKGGEKNVQKSNADHAALAGTAKKCIRPGTV